MEGGLNAERDGKAGWVRQSAGSESRCRIALWRPQGERAEGGSPPSARLSWPSDADAVRRAASCLPQCPPRGMGTRQPGPESAPDADTVLSVLLSIPASQRRPSRRDKLSNNNSNSGERGPGSCPEPGPLGGSALGQHSHTAGGGGARYDPGRGPGSRPPARRSLQGLRATATPGGGWRDTAAGRLAPHPPVLSVLWPPLPSPDGFPSRVKPFIMRLLSPRLVGRS